MNLEGVYAPIRHEIDGVKKELNRMVATFEFPATREVITHFSKMPGKFLRPALLLLSAKAIRENLSKEELKPLVISAAGVELIHDASLVHDDILDQDVERRGQATINGLWGTKIALLAGDVLYSRAFGLLVSTLPAPLLQRVVELNETMCSAEIEQARTLHQNLSRKEYFRIIEGKTAAFMSLCCRLGATLAKGTPEQIEALAAFGMHFGLAYQLFDDNADGDLACPEVDGLKEGRTQAEHAVEGLRPLGPSAARDRLIDLAQHLIQANSSRT